MTPDEIIEVYAGQKAGRIWQVNSGAAHGSIWITPGDQSLANLRSIGNVPVRLAPFPDEIALPARVIPAPLREAPKNRTTVYFADPFLKDFTGSEKWEGSTLQQMWLARGLLHLLKANAIKASKAMCPYA